MAPTRLTLDKDGRRSSGVPPFLLSNLGNTLRKHSSLELHGRARAPRQALQVDRLATRLPPKLKGRDL